QRGIDRQSGDREVLHRPLRLRRPLGMGRDSDLAHRIVFDAELGGRAGLAGHGPDRTAAGPSVAPSEVCLLGFAPIVKRSTRRMSPRVRCLGGIIVLALLAPLMVAGVASADQISDKQSQAAQLAQELQAKGDRESALAEQVDQARLHADDVNAKLAKARADMAALDVQAAAVKSALRDQATDSYI